MLVRGKKEKRKLHEEPNSEQICHSDCQKRRWDVEARDGLKKTHVKVKATLATKLNLTK